MLQVNQTINDLVANANADMRRFYGNDGTTFALLVVIMSIASKVAPRAKAWELKTNTPIDMTPWKGAPIVSAILVIFVLLIYVSFHQ